MTRIWRPVLTGLPFKDWEIVMAIFISSRRSAPLPCHAIPTQAWVRSNLLERKLLMDCIAPASFTHTHTLPWSRPLFFL